MEGRDVRERDKLELRRYGDLVNIFGGLREVTEGRKG